MALSYSQLETVWTEGGGSAAMAPIMAAIALAESSGNPSAIGPGGSWGLWQIQPQDWGFSQSSDPVTQASDANQILGKQGLSAWSTYNNGAYSKFYSPGTAPSTDAQLASSSTSGGQSAGPCLWNVGSFCADGVVGIGAIGGGAVLLIIAGFLIFV